MNNDALNLSLSLIQASAKLAAERDRGASRNRLRQAGRTCCICDEHLPEPHIRGERRCKRCGPAQTKRVYMSFLFHGEWVCHFVDKDLKTSLPRVLRFRDSEKILEVVQRGWGAMETEARKAFQRAVEIGHGGVWLALNKVQYNTLKDCNPANRGAAERVNDCETGGVRV